VLTPVHLDSLAPASRRLLAALARRPWAGDFYLAGSAALALYLAHRPVVGLDLMSATSRLASSDRRDLLADLLALDPGFTVETARDGYLSARSGAGVPLRLYHYPYPLADPLAGAAGVAVTSPVDLGLMKIAAIISRGTRRDYLDLHVLRAGGGSWEEVVRSGRLVASGRVVACGRAGGCASAGRREHGAAWMRGGGERGEVVVGAAGAGRPGARSGFLVDGGRPPLYRAALDHRRSLGIRWDARPSKAPGHPAPAAGEPSTPLKKKENGQTSNLASRDSRPVLGGGAKGMDAAAVAGTDGRSREPSPPIRPGGPHGGRPGSGPGATDRGTLVLRSGRRPCRPVGGDRTNGRPPRWAAATEPWHPRLA
jgi:hypothetical protein